MCLDLLGCCLQAELALEGGKKLALFDKRRPGLPQAECAVLRPGESTDMVIDQHLSSAGAHT